MPFWTESELRGELSRNQTTAADRLLRNVDMILFDTRLQHESFASLLHLIGGLAWQKQPRECSRLRANLERILVDTRLAPAHSPLVVRLLQSLPGPQDS
ncbi:MAG: hypothetical protein WBA12_07295 [Catalinimonas sp.]